MTNNTKPRTNAHLGDRDALHEMLVASLTLAAQIGEAETGDCVMEALRTLHRDDVFDEPGDVGFA